MKNLNIALPEDLAQSIERSPDKSNFITEAIKEKLQRIKKEKLDKLLIEGYKATRREGESIDKEWEKITLEGWK